MGASPARSEGINSQRIVILPEPPIRVSECKRQLSGADRVRSGPLSAIVEPGPVVDPCTTPDTGPAVIFEEILLREEVDVPDLGALFRCHFSEIA